MSIMREEGIELLLASALLSQLENLDSGVLVGLGIH